MTDISEVVDVSILIQDAAPGRANFGTMGVFAYHTNGPAVLTYDTTPDGLAAMVADGFGVGHDAYRKVSAVAGQSPRKIKQVKVFNRAAVNAQELLITPTVTAEGYVYGPWSVSVGAVTTEVSYTVLAAATPTIIATALHALFSAIAGVTSTDNTGSFSLEPTADETRIYLRNTPKGVTVKDMSADAGIATDLAAGQLDDPDFYGFVIDGMSEAELNAAGAWAQANGKIFVGLSADTDVFTSSSTDIASDFLAAAYHRAGVFCSADMVGQFHAALMGGELSANPGASVWENKRLSGPVADPLTPGRLNYAKAKKAGLYLNIKNVSVTRNISGGSGRFFDITRDTDWIKENIGVAVYTMLLNQAKVPYTSLGISLVETQVWKILNAATRLGILAPQTATVTSLSETEILDADRVARTYQGTSFAGRLAGAIQTVTIAGEISA